MRKEFDFIEVTVDGSKTLINIDNVLYINPGADENAVFTLVNGERLYCEDSLDDVMLMLSTVKIEEVN